MLQVSRTGKYPELFAFASHMQERLEGNAHKGHWRGCSSEELLARVQEELDELKDAVEIGENKLHVAMEAADVANMAMMVADCYYEEKTRC